MDNFSMMVEHRTLERPRVRCATQLKVCARAVNRSYHPFIWPFQLPALYLRTPERCVCKTGQCRKQFMKPCFRVDHALASFLVMNKKKKNAPVCPHTSPPSLKFCFSGSFI